MMMMIRVLDLRNRKRKPKEKDKLSSCTLIKNKKRHAGYR
jgi:hypothetical protein